MLEIVDLYKKIGDRQVLKGINMNIEEGSIYGLVGPNGGGKTSLIKNIVGIYDIDSGSIEFSGEKIKNNIDIKHSIGYIEDNIHYPLGYKLFELKEFYKGIYRDFDEDLYREYMEEFKLDEKLKVKTLSKGQSMQLQFILNLSIKPKLLIIDEGLSNIDHLVKEALIEILIDRVVVDKMTVLITSHSISDIEKLCDCIGLIYDGKIILEGEVDDIKSSYTRLNIVFENLNDIGILDELNLLKKSINGNIYNLLIKENYNNIVEKFKRVDTILFERQNLSLEDIFLYEMEVLAYE